MTRQPRHAGDVIRVGLAVLVIVMSAVFVHRHRVGVLETDLFRLVNDLPRALFPILWPVMQLGNFLAIPVAALVVLATRRYRLAAEILVAGVGVWLLAKEIKTLVPRGRPATLLAGVHIHGAAAGGRGFLSGHAAVVAAIATLVTPYLGRRTRRIALLLVLVVCIARVYVGAHLPLDVIAGAALGWGAASAVHLMLGTPSGRPSARSLRAALDRLGFPITDLQSVTVGYGDADIYRAVGATGDQFFVKVLPRERRDRDLLYRMWLWVTRRPGGSGRTPAAQVDHEALMASLARLAGARTPSVLASGHYGNGAGLLVREWVDGHPLGSAGAPSEAAVIDAADNIAALRSVGIAHGRISADTLLVDDVARCWLVGLEHAELRASPERLSDDRADLVSALAPLVGTVEAARIADLPASRQAVDGGRQLT